MPNESLTGPLVNAAPPRQLLAGTAYSLRGVWEYRELLGLLIRRELKARYKDSSLGLVWSLIRPLTLLLIYYVAIGKFLGAERSIPEFAVYIYTGLTAWTLLSEIISGTTASIITNAGLVKKVYLPRELFPLAAIGSALFNFVIQFAILLVAILFTQGVEYTPWVFAVPLALVLILLLGLALGLFLSAANVYLRDVQHLVEVAILVLFWASPIVYSYDMVHSVLQGNLLEQLYLSNPITVIVLGFQRGLWAAGSNDPSFYWPPDLLPRMLIMIAIAAVLTWVAQRFFARMEGNFAQEL